MTHRERPPTPWWDRLIYAAVGALATSFWGYMGYLVWRSLTA